MAELDEEIYKGLSDHRLLNCKIMTDDGKVSVLQYLVDNKIKSNSNLQKLPRSKLDDLIDQIEGSNDRKAFRRWWTELQPKPLRLNRNSAKSEEAIMIKVDVDPQAMTSSGDFSGKYTAIWIPEDFLERKIQNAESNPISVISLCGEIFQFFIYFLIDTLYIGPTGGGKSFIASTFLPSSVDVDSLPTVALESQFQPTTAHVSAYHGILNSEKILLLDNEGEDGGIPMNMVEARRSKLSKFNEQMSKAMFKVLEKSANQRHEINKRIIPSLVYSLSDVVIFVDNSEMHNTLRTQRINDFARRTHNGIASISFKPALILVQNKWNYDGKGPAMLDLTEVNELQWIKSQLDPFFSRISMLRLPSMNDLTLFYDGLNLLHSRVALYKDAVKADRANSGCLYSEIKWWYIVRKSVEFINKRGNTVDEMLNCLQSMSFITNDSEQTATLSLSLITSKGIQFYEAVQYVLEWNAYLLAEKAKIENVFDLDYVKSVMETVIRACFDQEPCQVSPFAHSGKTYPCTQLRKGHTQFHKNPAILYSPTSNPIAYYLSFGFWQDQSPCIWPAPHGCIGNIRRIEHSLEYCTGLCRTFYDESNKNFLKLFKKIMPPSYLVDVNSINTASEHSQLCAHCLRDVERMVSLQNVDCRHQLCEQCVEYRKTLINNSNVISCPFCCVESVVPTVTLPCSPSSVVLSLDGGGVRGQALVTALLKISERFAPLQLNMLFDVICGTGIGGMLAIMLMNDADDSAISQFQSCLAGMATEIFGVSAPLLMYRSLIGYPVFSSSVLEKSLKKLYGEKRIEVTDRSPFICSTAYDTIRGSTVLLSNFNIGRSRIGSQEKDHYCCEPNISTCSNIDTWTAARASAAAPGFFSAVAHGDKSLVDGAVKASCPAIMGCEVSDALGMKVEMILSLGTGQSVGSSTDKNHLVFNKKTINMSAEADLLWESMLHSVKYEQAAKIRINPPHIGDFPAFSAQSIESVISKVNEFYASSAGEEELNKAFVSIYSKMWEATIENNCLIISFKASRLHFDTISRSQLIKIITDRAGVYDETCEITVLIELAKKKINEMPLLKPFDDIFLISYDDGTESFLKGKSILLKPNSRVIDIRFYHDEHKVSICGFPK